MLCAPTSFSSRYKLFGKVYFVKQCQHANAQQENSKIQKQVLPWQVSYPFYTPQYWAANYEMKASGISKELCVLKFDSSNVISLRRLVQFQFGINAQMQKCELNVELPPSRKNVVMNFEAASDDE